MATHKRDQKIRRITRIVIYFLLIAFLLILFIMVNRWSGQGESQPKSGENPITYTGSPHHL